MRITGTHTSTGRPNEFETSTAEDVIGEWHADLVEHGYTPAAAVEQLLLRTPTGGATWKVLEDNAFRARLQDDDDALRAAYLKQLDQDKQTDYLTQG